MRKIFMTLVIAGLTMVAVAPPAVADSREEVMERFMGKWDITEGVSFGTPIPGEELDGSITVITKDTITTYDRDENMTYQAKYVLNTQADPMEIDMVATKSGIEMKVLAIVKFEWLDLDGDNEFQLAYSLTPGERPKDFTSLIGSKILTMELEQYENDD